MWPCHEARATHALSQKKTPIKGVPAPTSIKWMTALARMWVVLRVSGVFRGPNTTSKPLGWEVGIAGSPMDGPRPSLFPPGCEPQRHPILPVHPGEAGDSCGRPAPRTDGWLCRPSATVRPRKIAKNPALIHSGTGKGAQFKHKSDVQKWLDIIRGQYAPNGLILMTPVRSARSVTRADPPFDALPVADQVEGAACRSGRRGASKVAR